VALQSSAAVDPWACSSAALALMSFNPGLCGTDRLSGPPRCLASSKLTIIIPRLRRQALLLCLRAPARVTTNFRVPCPTLPGSGSHAAFAAAVPPRLRSLLPFKYHTRAMVVSIDGAFRPARPAPAPFKRDDGATTASLAHDNCRSGGPDQGLTLTPMRRRCGRLGWHMSRFRTGTQAVKSWSNQARLPQPSSSRPGRAKHNDFSQARVDYIDQSLRIGI
jgi:hypothetical protein